MVNYEFYRKYKTKYPADEIFRIVWWQVMLVFVGAVLIEPFVIYKRFRHVPFTPGYYVGEIKYFVIVCMPFLLLYLWIRWRDSLRRSRGYYWIGKFEVIRKQMTFLTCYLILTPGKENKLRVNRSFFNKVHEGDVVMIRRDSLGKIERIMPVKNFAARLRRLSLRSGNNPERAD